MRSVRARMDLLTRDSNSVDIELRQADAMNDKAKQLGFPGLELASGLRSVSHLFGKTKPRCGIYLLAFDDGALYIGQAVDVVRRFAQHRKNYPDIAGFSFLPTPKGRLDKVEIDLIHRADRAKLSLRNCEHVSNVAGETDLDYLISPDEQERWLAQPLEMNASDTSSRMRLPPQHESRHAHNYRQFLAHPYHEEVVEMLRLYINRCLPQPRLTEYSFWSLSCMPSTNASTWPRMAVVNLGMMEAFVLCFNKKDSSDNLAFVTVAAENLLQQLEKKNKYLDVDDADNRGYRDAGQDQVTLLTSFDGMRALLADPDVQDAARLLALRVMRKGATIYAKHHCQQLADLVFKKAG